MSRIFEDFDLNNNNKFINNTSNQPPRLDIPPKPKVLVKFGFTKNWSAELVAKTGRNVN